MDTNESLRDQLAKANDTIEQLREKLWQIVQPDTWADYRGIKLTRSEQLLLNILHQSPVTVSYERLRNRLDAALRRTDTGNRISIQARIGKLRAKLFAAKPPIVISTVHAVGFFIDDENKKKLAVRRIEPNDRT